MQVTGTAGTLGAAQLYQAGVATKRSTQLEVVTAEGDRVTLSTSSTRAAGLAVVGASSGGSRVGAAVMQAESADTLSISVEGNLDKDELQDLMKIIKAFQRAAAKGDARQFLHRLTRPDIDTIASVSASASYETVAMATSAAVTAQAVAAPAEQAAEPEQVTEPLAA
jgi:hypothetical protein